MILQACEYLHLDSMEFNFNSLLLSLRMVMLSSTRSKHDIFKSSERSFRFVHVSVVFADDAKSLAETKFQMVVEVNAFDQLFASLSNNHSVL